MASKKCPKCGEDNPAEAVMCWACYTPLSGGPAIAGMSAATAALGAKGPMGGKAPVGVPTVEEDSAKKGVDPKLIGVGAFLVIGGVIAFLVNSSMGGGTTEDTPLTSGDPSVVQIMPSGSSSAPQTSMAPSTSPSTSSGNSTPSVAPVALPFKTVTTPDPKNPVGTVGILIAADKEREAAGFARYAKDMLMRNGRWQNMQVCVFVDQKTANTFKQFQAPRKGKPLTKSDFAALANTGVWNSTPIYYESRGKTERIFRPSQSPNSWWSSI